jgi:hypothetical protein
LAVDAYYAAERISAFPISLSCHTDYNALAMGL